MSSSNGHRIHQRHQPHGRRPAALRGGSDGVFCGHDHPDCWRVTSACAKCGPIFSAKRSMCWQTASRPWLSAASRRTAAFGLERTKGRVQGQ